MPSSLGDTLNYSTIAPGPPAVGRRMTTWWLATTAASMPTAMDYPRSPSSPFARAAAGVDRPRSRRRPQWLVATGRGLSALCLRLSPDTTRHSRWHVGRPSLWVIRCSRLTWRGGAPSIPSTGSARETDPGDDLFHEPEAQPKCVTAGVPPEATLRSTTRGRWMPLLIQAGYRAVTAVVQIIPSPYRDPGGTSVQAVVVALQTRLAPKHQTSLRPR